MDLQLYFRVLWRFRLLTMIGAAHRVLLALLVGRQHRFIVRVAPAPVPRVGAVGEPRDRSRDGEEVPARPVRVRRGDPADDDRPPEDVRTAVCGSPGRFTELANIYAELAMSDPVRQLMLRDGPLRGTHPGGRAEGDQRLRRTAAVVVRRRDLDQSRKRRCDSPAAERRH